MQLPGVAAPDLVLPEGETSTLPGESGVVAIFCPEEFQDNQEKVQECAGRPEIRSGWRPGDSGENFDRAIQLLRTNRTRGFAGDNVGGQFSGEAARRAVELQRRQQLEDFRRSQSGVNDLGTDAANANDPSRADLPNVGPEGFEPSWTQRDDPNLSPSDLEEIRRDLERSDRARRGEDLDDD